MVAPIRTIEGSDGPCTRGRAPLVKICGIRTPEDLTAAEGADLVGVVVEVPSSPRSRSVDQARVLFKRAEGRFRRVAVLVAPSAVAVRRTLSEAMPDLVQVHGAIPSGLSAEERARLIPSISVPLAGAAAPAPVPPPGGPYPFLHLDSSGGPLPGGTGLTSDWQLCHQLVEGWPTAKFLLGGGLTPENVAEAVRTVRPFGVDVSSGVESRPGEKSRARVERFLAAVRTVPGRKT